MTTPLDPVTLEVIRNALPAVANEMAVDLQRTSYNMMIYEVRDFCTALVNTAALRQARLCARRRRHHQSPGGRGAAPQQHRHLRTVLS